MSSIGTARYGEPRTTIESPVLIVGAGPVGLALASDLGWRGVRCLLVDAGDGFVDHPRATALNRRSMEVLRRWGIADVVRRQSSEFDATRRLRYCTSLAGLQITRIEWMPYSDTRATRNFAKSPERPVRCDQQRLVPALREFATSFRDTSLRYRWQLEDVQQRGDCVLATIADHAARERRRVAAAIVVDCSGAASKVRELLGIRLCAAGASPRDDRTPDKPFSEDCLSWIVDVPGLASAHDLAPGEKVILVEHGGTLRTLERFMSGDRYRLDVRIPRAATTPPLRDDYSGATGEVAQAGRHLADFAGVPIDHRVLTSALWTSRIAVAERFGEGRVLLMGDAAHGVGPALDLGLDAGIGDAANLGWKIEATLAGWTSSGLVESYGQERRRIALQYADIGINAVRRRDAVEIPADLEMDTPSGRAGRKRLERTLEIGEHLTPISDWMAFGDCYDESPLVFSEEAEETRFLLNDVGLSTKPGARAPHAQLSNGASLLDRFGKGFVLLRLGPKAPEPSGFGRAFAHRGVPLAYESVEDPAVARLFGRRLVLVRPDGHVSWRGNELPADPLAVADRVRGI